MGPEQGSLGRLVEVLLGSWSLAMRSRFQDSGAFWPQPRLSFRRFDSFADLGRPDVYLQSRNSDTLVDVWQSLQDWTPPRIFRIPGINSELNLPGPSAYNLQKLAFYHLTLYAL